jgi:hypothetical protein
MMNNTRNTTNKIQAIWVAAPAMPVNPKMPAINAMIKKANAQLSIESSSCSFADSETRCSARFKKQGLCLLVDSTDITRLLSSAVRME